MKIINFTAVEILPKLLSKEKTQTIRPVWNKDKPYLKVGDKVQIMWNQRSKFKWFNRYTGKGTGLKSGNKSLPIFEFITKQLGTAEITQVFKIEMYEDGDFTTYPCGYGVMKIDNEGKWIKRMDLWDIKLADRFAKRDGFKSIRDMFNWFDKQYSLDKPKQFYVYRWVWR